MGAPNAWLDFIHQYNDLILLAVAFLVYRIKTNDLPHIQARLDELSGRRKGSK